MSRILIITSGPLSRNPRVVKEAETLGRAGHDVTVLMVRNHPASEPLDLALLRDAPFRRVVLDLLARDIAGRRRAIVSRARTWLARLLVQRFGFQAPHALGPVSALLTLARTHPADLTIVHTEPGFWVGVQLMKAGRKVAADFEDWHSEDLPLESRTTRPLQALRGLERELLQRSAYTTTTSHALATALHHRYGGRRPAIITNSFPLQPQPRIFPNAPPVFFWFSKTVGPSRGLESFLAAWSLTRQPSRVVLLGEVQPTYRETLMGCISPDRRGPITFLDLVPPGDLPALIARHDIGLALERDQIANSDLTISNKILQYLNAGLAVVASSTAGQREVLALAPAAGVIVDAQAPDVFAATLDTLLSDPIALARRQAAARQAAQEIYSWEHEAPKLRSLVAAALESRSP